MNNRDFSPKTELERQGLALSVLALSLGNSIGVAAGAAAKMPGWTHGLVGAGVAYLALTKLTENIARLPLLPAGDRCLQFKQLVGLAMKESVPELFSQEAKGAGDRAVERAIELFTDEVSTPRLREQLPTELQDALLEMLVSQRATRA